MLAMLLLSTWLAAGLLVDLVVSRHSRRIERWYGPWHLLGSLLMGPLILAGATVAALLLGLTSLIVGMVSGDRD